MDLLIRGFELITHAANGVDKFWHVRVVDFGAQAAHSDFDHVGVAVEIEVPHLRGDQGARQHFALTAGEQLQQGEFFIGQADALTAPALTRRRSTSISRSAML